MTNQIATVKRSAGSIAREAVIRLACYAVGFTVMGVIAPVTGVTSLPTAIGVGLGFTIGLTLFDTVLLIVKNWRAGR